MVIVTEVVVGSLHNVLTRFEGVPGASTEARAVRKCAFAFGMLYIFIGMILDHLYKSARNQH